MSVVAYFIHGYSGWGDNCFFPDIKEQLKNAGVTSHSPDLPNPKRPLYPEWESTLSNLINETWHGEKIMFCTHSMGGYFILRFISNHIGEEWVKHIQGLCLVGPSSLKRPEYMPMYDEDLQLEKIANLSIQIHVLYSIDDPRIPKTHIELLQKYLGNMSGFHYHEFTNYAHFQVKKVPEAADVCLKLVNEAKN